MTHHDVLLCVGDVGKSETFYPEHTQPRTLINICEGGPFAGRGTGRQGKRGRTAKLEGGGSLGDGGMGRGAAQTSGLWGEAAKDS